MHNGYQQMPDQMAMPDHQCYHHCQGHDYNLRDHGPAPFVTNIHADAMENQAFRRSLWTGEYFQITLMNLMPGECIGLEMHPNVDQFLRVEHGEGMTQMGPKKDEMNYMCHVFEDCAIVVPAGTWHNLTNTGCTPLKLYSIYAPPNHPFGTVHQTKADAMAAEGDY